MAIVDLGTLTFPVGGGQQSFTQFPYRDARAYSVFLTIAAATPTNIFSYLIRYFYFRLKLNYLYENQHINTNV